MINISKELFRRLMREAYLLGLNDGYEVNFNELTEAYIKKLDKGEK